MTISPPNDEADADDLVVRAKTDRAAFAGLYDRFFPLVHRYCRRRLLDGATADDVSSEVFLQVARAIRRFPGTSVEDFRRWVYRIATNAINAQLRKSSRRGKALEQAARRGWWSKTGTAADQPDAAVADFDAVANALTRLSPREQAVVTLRFMEELSYEEVGAIVGLRPATLRVIVSRALQKLRRQLPNPLGTGTERRTRSGP